VHFIFGKCWLSSQAFWVALSNSCQTRKEAAARQEERDPLAEAQARLLGLWKEKQLLSRRLLALARIKHCFAQF
jgi:hypothetical protein